MRTTIDVMPILLLYVPPVFPSIILCAVSLVSVVPPRNVARFQRWLQLQLHLITKWLDKKLIIGGTNNSSRLVSWLLWANSQKFSSFRAMGVKFQFCWDYQSAVQGWGDAAHAATPRYTASKSLMASSCLCPGYMCSFTRHNMTGCVHSRNYTSRYYWGKQISITYNSLCNIIKKLLYKISTLFSQCASLQGLMDDFV